VTLVQDANVSAKSVHGGFLYPPSDASWGPVSPVGAYINLTYTPESIQAQSTTIRVETPDGQEFDATFDLADLR
jgi:hypothetical protein